MRDRVFPAVVWPARTHSRSPLLGYVLGIALFFGVLELVMLVSPVPSSALRIFLEENGPVETAQLVGYILLAVFAFQAAREDPRPAFPRCWQALGWLAIIAAGEECDWGNITRVFAAVRHGSQHNLLSIHNTIEAYILELPSLWKDAALILFFVSAAAILYGAFVLPLILSGELWRGLGRHSGRLALAGVVFLFASQFFDLGLFPFSTRTNPYVDFWDEAFELAAVACFLLAVREERRWIRDQVRGSLR